MAPRAHSLHRAQMIQRLRTLRLFSRAFIVLPWLPGIALRVCTVDRHNVAVAFCCCHCCVFPVICDNYYSFTARAGQDDVFQSLKMFPSIRAHWCTKAELRPARSASGREALLVLRLRRVLLGSHACEAARGCRMVHLKGEGWRGGVHCASSVKYEAARRHVTCRSIGASCGSACVRASCGVDGRH